MTSKYIEETTSKMSKSLDAFREELAHVRTGRASAHLLDHIDVEVYGSVMKLNQLGNISAPEARMLMVSPWDKSQLNVIEKALRTSNLELNPSNDGEVIRIPLPPLTEERRKELVKVVHGYAEESRIAVRNIRRHAIEEIKVAQKDGDIPEDDAHKLGDGIQKLTDDFIAKIDEALKAKDAEIMEV